MAEKIDPVLLEQYLKGADLSEPKLNLIEKILATDEHLAAQIANDIKDIPISETLKKGIQKAGKIVLKKKIAEVESNLWQSGFFIAETDIHDYLKGNLSAKKVTILEKRMQQDEDFVQKVEKEQQLLEGLKAAGKEQLRGKLAKVQEGLAEKGFFEEATDQTRNTAPAAKVVSIFSRRNLAIAASLLILVLAYFNFPRTTTADIDQTFASHFPYKDKISELIKDEISEVGYAASEKALQEQLLAALTAYNQKQYQKAIPLFNQVLAEQPNQLYAQLYLGQSYINLENWAAATQILQPLGENTSFPLRADALWGTAFGLLKMEKSKETRPILQQLTQFENPYQTAATEFLASF